MSWFGRVDIETAAQKLQAKVCCRVCLCLLVSVQEEPFCSTIALSCSNQSGVFKWLEKWITHHAGGVAAAAAAAAAAIGQASATLSTGERNSAAR
jgi:hypothetical protein